MNVTTGGTTVNMGVGVDIAPGANVNMGMFGGVTTDAVYLGNGVGVGVDVVPGANVNVGKGNGVGVGVPNGIAVNVAGGVCDARGRAGCAG